MGKGQVCADIVPDIVDKYGADGYAKGAGTAVEEAIKMLEMRETGKMAQ